MSGPSSPPSRAFDLSRYEALAAALEDAVLPQRGNVALVETDRGRTVEKLTYGALWERVRRLHAALLRAGVAPGERVGVCAANGPAWIAWAWAALRLGAVLVPLDARLDGPGLSALLRHARPRALLVDEAVWRRLGAEGRAAAPALTWVHAPAGDPAPARPLAALLEAGDAEPAPPPAPRARSDLAAIVYSSGTVGRPKGCLLTQGAYLSQLATLATLFPLEEDDVYLSILPAHHALDFMCGFLVPVLCGARVVHLRTLRPEWIVEACRSERVTHLSAVPAVLEALERRIRERLDALPPLPAAGLTALRRLNARLTRGGPREALSRALLLPVHRALGGRLRRVFAGGAMVGASTARFLWEVGIPVAIGYGLTEAGAVVAVNDLRPFRADSVGRPIPGCALRIADPGPDGVGEVQVRGPQVFQGYLDEPELTAEALTPDGWLRTGDLGAVDAAGHLRLLGRRKHMIVTAGGKNVYPEEVEARLAEVGAAELAVLAAPAVWGARPGEDEALLCALRAREGDDPGALLRRLAAANHRLPDPCRLTGALLVDEPFPRTTSLKVKREALATALAVRFARQDARPLGVA